MRFGLEKPYLYARIVMEMDTDGPRNWKDAATFQFLVDRVSDAYATTNTSDREKASHLEIATILWAQVHGLLSLQLANKLQLDTTQFTDLYGRCNRILHHWIQPNDGIVERKTN